MTLGDAQFRNTTPIIFNTSSYSRCPEILWISTHIQNYANKCSFIRYDTLLTDTFRKEEHTTKDCAYSSSFSEVHHKLRNSTSTKYKTSHLLQTMSGTLCCALEAHHSTGSSTHSTTRMQHPALKTTTKSTAKTLPCISIRVFILSNEQLNQSGTSSKSDQNQGCFAVALSVRAAPKPTSSQQHPGSHTWHSSYESVICYV